MWLSGCVKMDMAIDYFYVLKGNELNMQLPLPPSENDIQIGPFGTNTH